MTRFRLSLLRIVIYPVSDGKRITTPVVALVYGMPSVEVRDIVSR